MAMILDGTNGVTFPTWTTDTRPASPSTGMTGYNTTTGQIEVYNATTSAWSNAGKSTQPYTASYLIIAGGASGGSVGGGGAGGLLTSTITLTPLTVYTATVGAGGSGVSVGARGNSGSNSTFTGLTTAVGGGAGAGENSTPLSGGSGG